jgi:hypothetical protein
MYAHEGTLHLPTTAHHLCFISFRRKKSRRILYEQAIYAQSFTHLNFIYIYIHANNTFHLLYGLHNSSDKTLLLSPQEKKMKYHKRMFINNLLWTASEQQQILLPSCTFQLDAHTTLSFWQSTLNKMKHTDCSIRGISSFLEISDISLVLFTRCK